MNPIETEVRRIIEPAPVAVSEDASAPIRVWLVDDQEPLRLLMLELLERFDSIHCERHFGSAEAMFAQLTPHNAPDVLLMDVQMPGMGGLDALEKLASGAPITRVIMMTTFYDIERAARARQNGAFAFLVKTTPIDSVIEELRKAASTPLPTRPACAVSEVQPEHPEPLFPRALNAVRNLIVRKRCEAS